MLNRISTLTLILLGSAVLAMPSTAKALTTWYVDDDGPNDPGTGHETFPAARGMCWPAPRCPHSFEVGSTRA